ncbi:hypothetical protein OHA72_53185 [Dactylosporangium sp. NBC_01737]|uniref:hypothetical protein n=1 Tax=Dactylosporangium sp. NBC_01737 TaxID=2975959 RepID=UPI002E11443B|nr:hypothetical protein OHA72_53185 [Dactylosporangium sp. NBC_01737]
MQHVQVYRYCVTLACGDEAAALAATTEALRAVAERGSDEDDPAALFALARAAVKAGLRQRKEAATPAAGTLYAARPALEEQHWSLLALLLPEYADRPRHRQVDLTAVAAALGRKVDVTRKAVDRLVEPGGYLDVAMFTADAFAGGTGCPELAALVAGAKRPRPALRKAVAAHLPDCAVCTAALEARPGALTVLSAATVPAVPADLTGPVATPPPAASPDLGEPVVPEPGEDTDITAEILLDADRPLSTVYHPVPVPAVASVRLPLLRRPPVLLTVLVILLAVAAVAGFLGVRSGSPKGSAGAAGVPSAPGAGPPPAARAGAAGRRGVGVARRRPYTCRIGTCKGLDQSVGARRVAVGGERRAARPGR